MREVCFEANRAFSNCGRARYFYVPTAVYRNSLTLTVELDVFVMKTKFNVSAANSDFPCQTWIGGNLLVKENVCPLEPLFINSLVIVILYGFFLLFSEPLFDEEDSICVGSILFAGVIGSLAFVALISSIIVSVLCLKLRRIKDNEATVDGQISSKDLMTAAGNGRSTRMFNPGSGNNSIDTLRSRVSLKTEYVHSTQARIP